MHSSRSAPCQLATETWSAGMDRPAPIPPMWWMETLMAPKEVLIRALSSDQPAMVSEPSTIGSVSRRGEPTEPESS